MKLFEWIKNNKFAFVLLVVLAYFLLKDSFLVGNIGSDLVSQKGGFVSYEGSAPMADRGFQEDVMESMPAPAGQVVPQTEVEERMVQESSNVSMVVKDVRKSLDNIIDYAVSKNGYMISSSLNQPQEAPFAHLQVRVPQEELRPTLEYLRNLSVKVTSENLQGRDVTDEYFDLKARMETLVKTQVKFEEILDQATTVDQILRVQREIISLQSQIDSLKGRQEYLEKTSQTARLSVYMSSDEWSLPYAPQEPSFRPKVIFKTAVRSLVKCLRGLGKLGIWLLVYSIIWLPALIIFWWWKKRNRV